MRTMRGVWHVCIVVAVLLAVPIDSAWAECAWVLWKSSATPDNIRDAKWTIVEAHEAREECKTALNKDIASTASTWRDMGARLVKPNEVVEKGSGLFYRFMERGFTVARTDTEKPWFIVQKWDCYPDTIDPRGPKEGRR
jgi:hypothetical protein